MALRAMPLGSPSLAGRSNSTTGTPALAQWAAICAPITPAPSTATLRMISLLTRFSFACGPGAGLPAACDDGQPAGAPAPAGRYRTQGNPGPPRVSLPYTGAGWAEPGPGGAQNAIEYWAPKIHTRAS